MGSADDLSKTASSPGVLSGDVARSTRIVYLTPLEACFFLDEESQHGRANKIRRPASA